ncbi:hypothetical protein HD597_000349 [Nonomuraea thailandensis]|uniref:Uncharacterized protein n=1 Tax=Nonomuraea thailandensis TaxID=1188745 RepID=A0A9X2G9K8_9ACTN|nr:hypothetical protein [Nonomuraea thailandensis]
MDFSTRTGSLGAVWAWAGRFRPGTRRRRPAGGRSAGLAEVRTRSAGSAHRAGRPRVTTGSLAVAVADNELTAQDCKGSRFDANDHTPAGGAEQGLGSRRKALDPVLLRQIRSGRCDGRSGTTGDVGHDAEGRRIAHGITVPHRTDISETAGEEVLGPGPCQAGEKSHGRASPPASRRTLHHLERRCRGFPRYGLLRAVMLYRGEEQRRGADRQHRRRRSEGGRRGEPHGPEVVHRRTLPASGRAKPEPVTVACPSSRSV